MVTFKKIDLSDTRKAEELFEKKDSLGNMILKHKEFLLKIIMYQQNYFSYTSII